MSLNRRHGQSGFGGVNIVAPDVFLQRVRRRTARRLG
jgi:hypothetical protein